MGRDDDGFQAAGKRVAEGREGRRQRDLRISLWRQGHLRDHQHRAGRQGDRSGEMIAGLIRWSIANRFLVLLATVLMTAWGVWSLSRTPLDAIRDLSDVQVIIRTTFPGQAPQIVEDQVTYPLT